MEDSRDEPKTESCVDQGADNLEPPRALHTSGEDFSRTGYEPKPSSTRVVGGALDQKGAKEKSVRRTTSTASVHCAGREGVKGEDSTGCCEYCKANFKDIAETMGLLDWEVR